MLVWLRRVFLPVAILSFLGTAAVQAQNGGGFSALSGAEAEFFVLPDDVELTNSMRLERYGLTYERYQQFFGAAKVLGGQLTLHRDDTGAITTVIGAHYPGIAPSNAVGLTAANARGIAERDIGAAGTRRVELMIDPRTGRHFFRIETNRPDSLWVLWVGAQNGQIINKYDALKYLNCVDGVDSVPPPCGFGVEYDDGDPDDVKDLSGLTDQDGTEYRLWSDEERLGTFDDGDFDSSFGWPLARDDDDAWVLPGDQSPAQPALVDAQYYGHITNQYYLTRHGYNWVEQSNAQGGLNAMALVVHYRTNYNNAFWHKGTGAVFFGDGDQVTFRALTSLDVVGHELTHGVTDFTSGLIYQNESGALNEAFSDIMAANIEFYADDNDLEPSPNLTADWFVGEDIYIPEFETAAPGIRNMADPEEDGDPDHYSERYTGTGDNGGVHTNSGIPNHAYYLLVEGGLNAGCDASGSTHGHCPGGGVDPILLADAERIFFLGFIALNPTATMCDARAATEATALSLTPITPGLTNFQLAQRTTDAWVAVGLTDTVCPASGPYDPDGPTVGFINPADDADISGRLAIKIEATDNVGVALIQFFVDNSLKCESTTSPLTCTWNAKKASLGQHSLRARARDATDNVTDTVITVTVIRGGGGGGNSKPAASFTYSCTDMDCNFDGSGSADSDGTIESYAWTFGGGGTASGVTADHIYAEPGTYTVTLTVTDDAAESGSKSQLVSVGDTGGALSLTANGFKVKGVQHADLNWTDINAVYVYRDGVEVAAPNSAYNFSYDDNIDRKGGGSYLYQVCETGAPLNCSNIVTVVF